MKKNVIISMLVIVLAIFTINHFKSDIFDDIETAVKTGKSVELVALLGKMISNSKDMYACRELAPVITNANAGLEEKIKALRVACEQK